MTTLVAFALYAYLLWVRDEAADRNACNCPAHTVLPRATGVHRVNPDQWLAYNLSPRFNLDALALGRKDIKNFVSQLGRFRFVWQFITGRGIVP